MDYDKALELFEPVLGFEVHVELNTTTKMFCGCANEFGSGRQHEHLPDLPRPARRTAAGQREGDRVEHPARTRTRLRDRRVRAGSRARTTSTRTRAKNFQTSQYDEPIAYDGTITIELESGREVTVAIERAHMEEDAGKLTHVGGATGRIQGADYSLVDYNRGGVPLVEIVTKMIEGAEADAPEVGRTYVAGHPRASSRRSASRTRAWRRATCAATRTSPCGRADRRCSARAPRRRT